LFSDWNPRNNRGHEEQVEIYSNCDEVELFLNSKSLGAKSLPRDASPRTWRVNFEPGTLMAVGKNHGQIVARHQLRTAGKPFKIMLTVDRRKLAPLWDDVSHVTASVVDENGVQVPDSNPLVSFKVDGPGSIVAVDSAANSSHEPFQSLARHAFQGLCFAVVRATSGPGLIRLVASSPDLISGSATIETISKR